MQQEILSKAFVRGGNRAKKNPRYRHPFIPGLIQETLTRLRELGKDGKISLVSG